MITWSMVSARKICTLCPQSLKCIDGIEVYNGNPRQSARNEQNRKAEDFAQKPYLKTSGSDFHRQEDCGRGGMIFPQKFQDMKSFINAVKSEEGEMIRTMD